MLWSNNGHGRTAPAISSEGGQTSKVLSLRFLCAFLCTLFIFPAVSAQPEGKRITFYTAQTSYALPVMDRKGVEYVGLLEALEPIGAVSATTEAGKKWKLTFRDVEAQFEAGKTKAKIHGKSIELPAPLLVENGRGLVPLNSLKSVLPLLVGSAVDVHEPGRRVFIGAPPIRMTAKKLDNGKLAFTFSSPVNPTIATEAGRLRMVFTREPLLSDLQPLTVADTVISSASYSESNGAAEVTVTSTTPLIARFSEDRKTVTLAPVAPAPVQQTSLAKSAAPIAPAQQPTPKPRSHPLVLLDPAHGGDDRGATLTDKLAEKDVTLALARRLKHELELRGIETTLLRDGDLSLSFEQRASTANSSGTALYIGVHASSFGSGIRLYTSMLAAQPQKPLAFVRSQAAQAASLTISRAVASAISTELLKHDTPIVTLPAAVAPLNAVATAALEIEISPPPSGNAGDLAAASYQHSIVAALADAITAARSRLPQEALR